MPTAMSHLIPTMVPSGAVSSLNYNVNPRPRQTTPPVAPSSLSAELQYDLNTPNSSLLEYLTATNPSPDLVKRASTPIRNRSPYFWFDVRNLRRWDDFSIPTMAHMPSLLPLLQHPLPITALPTPPRQTQIPETLSALTEICTNHHMHIVNAALKIAQGAPSHLSMRVLKPVPSRPQPDFVSNYASDVEETLSGVLRAHVVGVVLCYESWNSGMRTEAAPQKVKYLEGLAHLHHFMREHGTRYGFIMTEIELVCVRYGGPSASKGGSDVPLFGFLELATPVQMSCHGPRDQGTETFPAGEGGAGGVAAIQMTATLALFWLHMLAKEDPMPGQYGWRVDVGGPAALTRQNHRERDEWVPTPIQKEKREAKTVRGWVWPDEQLSKKERGGVRKSAARASRF
ncbi:hypothetical protein M8818_007764 [Zalaria obscura]|uniref:Uncharacterized protein n=1 Tax=Zalaria obscura TaxID=2024903 RepID=A0ACC3S2X6_9PEZI